MPVLASPHGLEMSDALAAPKPGDDVPLFVLSIFRNQHCDRLTNCLLCREAEHALGTLIPCLDHTAEVLRDDGVIRILDYRSKILLDVFRRIHHHHGSYHDICSIIVQTRVTGNHFWRSASYFHIDD